MIVDWRAYFEGFSRQHGGEYVLYQQDADTGLGGYLLFSDGWRYGRSDPSGPEYAPLSEEHRVQLVQAYWTTRRAVIQEEVKKFKESILGLASLQQSRTAPVVIRERRVHEDDDGNRTSRMEAVEVDFELLLERYRNLVSDLRRCQHELESAKVCSVPVAEPFNMAGILEELDAANE